MSAFWPTSVATDAQLYTAVNSLQTTLSGSIDNAVTTITLASSTGFPTAGGVTIDNEVVFYTGISGAQLTGCTRGADGTTAASHSSGVPVGATVIAFHHNGLMAEIEAIETSLNLSASLAVITNSSGRLTTSTVTPTELAGLHSLTASRAVATTSGGILTTSSVTSTELGYLSGVTSAIQTQLNATVSNPLTSDLNFNSHKGTNLTNGSAAQDAAAFGQLKLLKYAINGTLTAFTTTSSTFQTTNLSVSFTPTSASSTIVIIAIGELRTNADQTSDVLGTIFQDSTEISPSPIMKGLSSGSLSGNIIVPATFMTQVAAGSTSSRTYSIKIRNQDNSTTVGFGNGENQQMLILELA